jgi:hypothetical protein
MYLRSLHSAHANLSRSICNFTRYINNNNLTVNKQLFFCQQDNDSLASLVSVAVNADLLILLTDVQVSSSHRKCSFPSLYLLIVLFLFVSMLNASLVSVAVNADLLILLTDVQARVPFYRKSVFYIVSILTISVVLQSLTL